MRKGQTVIATRRIESLRAGGIVIVANPGDIGCIVQSVRRGQRTISVAFEAGSRPVAVGIEEVRVFRAPPCD